MVVGDLTASFEVLIIGIARSDHQAAYLPTVVNVKIKSIS